MWYAGRPMKILLLPVLCVLTLSLSSCSLLSSVGSLLGGMAKAVGRTVTQADTPADPTAPEAVAQRGEQIVAKGTLRGKDLPATPSTADSVARR